MSHWDSIIPFLIIVPVAIWTKQVIPGLALGLIVASYMVEPSVLGGIEKTADYVITNLDKENKLYVIGFLYLFTGIINLIKVTGGIKGFIETTSSRIKTRKQTLWLIWLTIIGTFSSPNLRAATVAPMIKAIQRRIDATKERLAFLIEATGLPIIALIPVATAFIGYMISTIAFSLRDTHLAGEPFHLFVESIPYNLFSIIMIIMAFFYTLLGHPKWPLKQRKETDAEADRKIIEDSHPVVAKDLATRPQNLYIPISIALVLTVFLSWWDGYQKTHQPFNAFIHANVSKSMFVAILITLLATIVLLMLEKYPLKQIIENFFTGGNNLMPAIFIFAMVWALSSATKDLKLSEFVAASLNWVPRIWIMPILFFIGSLLAYFIGSTWGSWGLLMPIGLSMEKVSGIPIPMLVGVVFACGTFGGLVSPLSGVTITMSRIMDMEIMPYARYKLRHCLIPFILAAAGYLVIGLLF